MPAMSDLLWLTHESCGLHEMGAGHPESPERLAAVERAVAQSKIAARRTVVQADVAKPEMLARAHDPRVVDALLKAAPKTGYVELDADTTMNPHTADAALRAAGAVVQGVEAAIGKGPHPSM